MTSQTNFFRNAPGAFDQPSKYQTRLLPTDPQAATLPSDDNDQTTVARQIARGSNVVDLSDLEARGDPAVVPASATVVLRRSTIETSDHPELLNHCDDERDIPDTHRNSPS